MKEHQINQLNNFIMGWYADDVSFVEELDDYYNNAEVKFNGTFSPDVKESVDVPIIFGIGSDSYWNHLRTCIKLYSEKYSFSAQHELVIAEKSNLQKYKPNGGFKVWHFEKGNTELEVSRNLVFMTYLNDVPDGGTEFLYQDHKVKAEKGLTLIWPAEWTHVHKSELSKTSNKFIITGWINIKVIK